MPARDPLELAELLQGVDPDVRVRADADSDPALAESLDRREAVTEVRFRRRADADAGAGFLDELELGVGGVGCVDDRGARAEATRLGEELDRSEPVLGDALLDLAGLLVGVDVER